jgi:cellobiose epimerase
MNGPMSALDPEFGHDVAMAELRRIANWWLTKSFDAHNGGFVGQIDTRAAPVPAANKGVVLHSRMLWFFSEVAQVSPAGHYHIAAGRAYHYLLMHFRDTQFGGVFWELDRDGQVVDSKKHTYASCFFIYALCAYHRLTGEAEPLDVAMSCFDAIESHARDPMLGGYVEAFSRDWQPIEDMRLGAGDINAPKTMNSHLHLIEAYSALHGACPSARTAEALRHALEIFCTRIADPDAGHLRQFFDMQWSDLSRSVSFGHDIEASWLLREAAGCLGDPLLIEVALEISARLARACLRDGIGAHGQLCSQYLCDVRRRDESSIWWVQAEALVGFLDAYCVSRDAAYLVACETVWRFIRDNHIDDAAGEWHWSPPALPGTQGNPYKAGFWKGPYHNGRAMLECIRRFIALDAQRPRLDGSANG